MTFKPGIVRQLHPDAVKFYARLSARGVKDPTKLSPCEWGHLRLGLAANTFGNAVVTLPADLKDFEQAYGPVLARSPAYRDATAECFMFMAALEQQDVVASFAVQEELAYCFLATDVRGLRAEDVDMPYHAFILELPAGVLQTSPERFSVKALVVQRAADSTQGIERALAVTALAYDTAHDTQRVYQNMVMLSPGVDLEEQQTEWNSLRTYAEKNVHFYTDEKRLSYSVGFGVLRRYILNFLLYIAAKPDSVDYANPERTKKLKAKGNRAHRFEKEELVGLEAMRRVTTNVVIDPGIKDAVLDSGGSATWSLKYKTWVRGHWRKQVCGPGRSERKLIFIAPHVRGKDLEEGLVASHTYEVR